MYSNCIDCPAHNIIADPDPHDSFCYDDVAVVCTKLKKNETTNSESEYMADHQKFKTITVSCRPHRVRKESTTPDWCPLPIEQIKEKIDEF
jgi:hypothetical protein